MEEKVGSQGVPVLTGSRGRCGRARRTARRASGAEPPAAAAPGARKPGRRARAAGSCAPVRSGHAEPGVGFGSRSSEGAETDPLAAERQRGLGAPAGFGLHHLPDGAVPAGNQSFLLAPCFHGLGVLRLHGRGHPPLLSRPLPVLLLLPEGPDRTALGGAGPGPPLRGPGPGLHRGQPDPQRAAPPGVLAQLGGGPDAAGHGRPGAVRALPALPPGRPRLQGRPPQALPPDGRAGGLPAGHRDGAPGHGLGVVPGPDQRRGLVPVPGAAPLPRPGDHAPDLQLLPPQEEDGDVTPSAL